MQERLGAPTAPATMPSATSFFRSHCLLLESKSENEKAQKNLGFLVLQREKGISMPQGR